MTFLQRESTKFWCCVHLICGSGGLTMLLCICTNPSELQNFPVCLPRLCLLRDIILSKVYFPQNLINFLYSLSSPIIYDYFLYFGTIRYFSLGKKVLLFVKYKTNKNRTNKQKSTPAYIVVFVWHCFSRRILPKHFSCELQLRYSVLLSSWEGKADEEFCVLHSTLADDKSCGSSFYSLSRLAVFTRAEINVH